MMFSWLVIFCVYLCDFAKGSTPFSGCGYYPIGLQNKSIIPDKSFTSSTHSKSSYHQPHYGRLHGKTAWSVANNSLLNYLEIDFGGERIVCGVATQISGDEYTWVTRYKLQFSRNGTNWNAYKENGTDKIFQGNNDSRATVVRRYLKKLEIARYIRFIPTEYYHHVSMRVEVYAFDLEGPLMIPHQRSLLLKWKIKNGQVTSFLIEFRNKTKLEQFTLSNTTVEYNLTNLKPYTQYGIRLIVSFRKKPGLMSNWIYVTTKSAEPECSPVITNIQVTSSTSIHVAWQQELACLNGILRGYIIQYSVLGNSTVQVVNITDDRLSTSRNVSGLRKYTNYTFRILAYTIGEGPLSNASVMRTAEDAPISPPAHTSVQRINDSTFVLYWTRLPRDVSNGVVTKYQVRWRLLCKHPKILDFLPCQSKTHVVPSENNYASHHLLLYGRYDVSVRGYTSAGPGPYSRPIIIHTLCTGCDVNPVGIQHRSVIPDSSLSASSYYNALLVPQNGRLHGYGWAPSTTQDPRDYLQIDLGGLREICGVATQGGSVLNEWVMNYKLRFSKHGVFWNTYQENGTDKIFEGNTDMSTVERRCLQNIQSARYIRFVPTMYHTHKTMRVEVFTSYIDGPDIAAHQSSLQLSWKILNKVQVVSYLVEFRNKSRVESFILPNETMEYNLTNLQPYTEYSVRLKGMITSDGAGVWSRWIKVKTAAAAPTCSPVLLSVQTTSSTSVRITWKPPPANECRNGILRGHRIRYKLLGRERLANRTVNNTNATTYDLTGLQRYTWYTISVLAYTVANGPWSNKLTNRTGEDAPSCSPHIKSIYPLTSMSVQVNWSTLPNTRCRNGIVRGYKIAYKAIDEEELHSITETDPNSTATVVSGLKKFTNYSFQVLAYTVRDGNLSKAVYRRTMEDVPGCSPVINNTQITSTSIRVAWYQDRTCLNGMLRGYIIHYSLLLSNSTVQSINITDDRLYTSKNVSGLPTYTKYGFRILAYTIGEGPLSNASVFSTGEDAPSCSPTLLSAQTTTSTSVRLTWKPPPDNGCRNGIVRSFHIGFSPTSSKGNLTATKELKIGNSNTTTYEVGGLQEYTWYNFSVLAYTVARGPWSNVLKNRTGEGAPSCSPHIKSIYPLTSMSVQVNWSTLPNKRCRNGIVRGYKIAYKAIDEDELHSITETDPNSTATVVSGLKKFTNYSFQVLAYTVRDGNLSKAEFGKTKEDVPECSPVITNIQAASSTSINVAWQQDPKCLNGILRGYIIQYSLLGNSTTLSIKITDDHLTANSRVSGLRKYTNYTFRILAYTIGEGPKSKASNIRTAEDAPLCSPTLLSVQTTSSTSVRLTWKPPPDNGCRNGILRGYTIDYGTLYITLADPHATNHSVTGLHKYTWYTFSIQVFTVASGPRSNTLRNRTGEDAPDCSPTLVSVLNVSSTSINVTWTPLPRGNCTNGVLRGYKIYYNNTRTAKSLVMKIEDSVATTVNITGLSKYTAYSFRVLGYTVKDGPLSNEMTRRTSEDAPNCSPEIKSIEVLSSTKIRLSWNQLSNLACTNGIVRGYKVKFKRRVGDIQTYQISNAGITTADIDGLKIFTSYTFQVLAYTVKDGPPCKESSPTKTKADAPSAPVNVNRTLLPANGSIGPRVQIRWDEPREKNGVIQKYTLVYLYNSNKATEKKHEIKPEIGQRTYLHTIDVIGETSFSFKVNAYTIEDGPYQDGEDLVIPAYPPSIAPSNISRTEINDTTFLMQWNPIPRGKSNGIVTEYQVRRILSSRGRTHRAKRSVADDVKNDITVVPRYIITGLLSCAHYSISVRGYTSAGAGPYSAPINVNTSQPESPYGVLVEKRNATSVLLIWKKPANVIERIDKYTIEYRGHKTYMHKYKAEGNAITSGGTEIWINNLVPATHYEFWISALTACGTSPRSNSTTTQTSVANPLAPKIASIQQYHETGVSVNVTLFPASQINGPISAYQVIVEFLKQNNTHFHRLPSNYEQNAYSYPIAEKNNLDHYVTAEVDSDWFSSSRQLTIGDNMTYSKFRNVPLKKGARYHIYQRAVTNDKKKLLYSKEALVANVSVASDVVEETKSLVRDSSGSGTVVGIVVGLMLLIVLVIFVAYFVWKRQRNIKKEDIQNISLPLVAISPEHLNSTNGQVSGLAAEKEEVIKPIHVSKFAEYMAAMRKDDFSELLRQFKTIPSTHVFSCIAAKKPTNKFKNRYGNIVAYDHSRVKLQRINGDEDSDYINASFMHGYDGTQKTYIATQGPLPDTTNDFWRLIWEQNTTCIVMLTNLIELGKRKCHQYWPENSEQYADITIKNHKTEVFADYHIRTLLLSKGTNEEISRRLLLFHFTAWPDKGVPRNAAALLSFRRKVREMSKWNAGPTVIHCSAGVGRTGTYMIIDAMLEQVASKKTIDIYNYMTLLRKDRPYMVQTSEQYVFTHMALFEEITCGNTEIQASDLETAMQNLSCIEHEENLSGYAIEFQRLEFVASYGLKGECGVGQEDENANKNRYSNIIPVNLSRVILCTEDSNQGDYINATFIDTHTERNAFIMTQAPMENTIADFWRMVMDYEIGTIVMLNNLEEGDEIFPEYWPEEEPVTYSGGIQVELLNIEECDDILLRTFTVSYQSAQRSIQHLQYTGWDNNFVPNNPQSLLDLFEKVCKSQQKCGNNPVVVQCSNGVGRSGTFCAIASCLERVKQEQVLDVFQTIKNIRVNRPGAVETLSQYECCYITLKHYLDSFSDYANFA